MRVRAINVPSDAAKYFGNSVESHPAIWLAPSRLTLAIKNIYLFKRKS